MSSDTTGPCRLDYSKEALWERSYLKKKCKELNIEEDYILYDRRLCINHLGVFFFVHSAVTVIKCIMLMVACEYPEFIHVDVGVYMTSAILTVSILTINFSESIVSRNKWIIYVSSAVAAALIVLADVTIFLYHHYIHEWTVLPFYDAYVLYVIYLCFPIPALRAPFILASFVSITYLIIIYFYTLESEFISFQQAPYMIVEILHITCCHLVGLFYRLLNEITVRSSFIDRHQYVMEEIWLREAKNKEKQLLHGILPPDIARPFEKEIRYRITKTNKIHSEYQSSNLNQGIMALQFHPDVTILYADVVNYTHLTTTLTVNALVALLHDLYGRFDVAARIFKVQRIKFLGDCYYCVAGLTRPDPDHAKCCVELAQRMIAHIREVRSIRNLDIDMRIGVHSGSLMAGVMGAAKLQYDVWGEDVIIAGILESTGRPGHIHISERTSKMLIDNPYELLPGTEKALQHPHLASKNIKTFLIAALDYKVVLRKENSSQALETIQDLEMQKKEALRIEFDKLPVGSFHVKNKFTTIFRKKSRNSTTKRATTRPQIGFLFLNFRDSRKELNYMKQPDYMLRYSVLLAWFAGIFLVYLVNISQKADKTSVNNNIIVMMLLTTPVIILWFKKACHWRYGNVPHNFTKCSCFIFKTAEFIQSSLIIRMGIYMNMIVCYFWIIFQVLNDCDYDEFHLQLIDSKLYHYEMDKYKCFYPWELTNMMSLMIALSIIFTRIPWMVKIIVSVLEGTTYMIIMFIQFEYVINRSSTTNPYFDSEYAHGFKIMTTLGCLYFMERQAEFNSRVNYNWKLELLKKQNDAVITNKSITILLQNILPAHVVNIYLTSLAKHQLYAENYKMVAVMFASLQDFKMDVRNLRILNEIISQFDKILYLYREDYLVEKIKIVGCTYMAACGLDPRFMGRINERSGNKASVIVEVSRAQRYLASSISVTDNPPVPNEEVVFVLTTFALDLLRTLWTWRNVYTNILDRSLFTGNMKIGISCGEVMAGVVGASQVHYDIWGTPVNMASRMDSTGLSGHIHVCEDTAYILRKFGIECDYRGLTFVKGLGILPTYFVGVSEEHEFRNTPQNLT